ncbi:uncharacterized protein VICG_01174 [Vittaforma corneae ATCC 50505]|uniref:Uncharacterized protein n=1 Tax=Vittaforma corneae (strain ATCC 50505) TaxID=993615 RepID=L2GND0_VITCO|nr:uncharacterized protein VICG_01174 [Vittaforma corneae ATCC 50505]ELA41822.1 hypothetical protein VICG_01174 [Vittaforma corneae ATCC 50505]
MFGRIIVLRYINVYIQDIPEEDIRRVEDRIGVLDLCNNSLRDVPRSVERLRNLQLILIIQNPIQFLPDFFFRLDFLDCILIADCLITYIPDAIANLRNLTILAMPRNRIEYVSPYIFTMPKLECIRLDKNCIRGLYLPQNLHIGSKKIYASDNPFNEMDLNNGLLGKITLRRVFGKNIYFTKEEEEAANPANQKPSTLKILMYAFLVGVIIGIIEAALGIN